MAPHSTWKGAHARSPTGLLDEFPGVVLLVTVQVQGASDVPPFPCVVDCEAGPVGLVAAGDVQTPEVRNHTIDVQKDACLLHTSWPLNGAVVIFFLRPFPKMTIIEGKGAG